ncbi:hypothetical protein VPNG_05411 [Cytospora leucostoma]|uniref:K Homology domain-containing protein n=1 Tax=Cytospora leucostoma TaxID=1230097 RepID=A0A423XBI4_9PEZI|nr:hypothetical protein VPNG_05411 [Cytospora leucostoma]
MSLGITALWRVRPQQQRLGRLIPREPLLFNGPPTYRRSPNCLLSNVTGLGYSSTTRDPSHTGDGVKAEHETDRVHTDDLPRSSPSITRVKVRGPPKERDLGRGVGQRRARAPKDEVEKLEESLERNNFATSVLVEPAKIYPYKKDTRKSLRDHHKSVSAQVYFQRARQDSLDPGMATDPSITDWRRVFEHLARVTPDQPKDWIEDGIKVQLPDNIFAMIMVEGGDAKIGAIRRRTGVSVKASTGEGPGDRSSLLLSGSRQAINRAAEELRHIAGSITITRLSGPLVPGEARKESFLGKGFFVPPLSREEGGRFRRSKIGFNILTVPWPDVMSHHAFEEFVASLTDSDILPHLDSELYTPEKYALLLDHERAIARQLQRAFTRHNARKWASCSALKMALFYLCEKGDKYLTEARAIFVSMDQHGLHMDADVFNILLRAPTKTRNLRKFQQTLQLMTRRGVAPNLDTWMLFLRMIESLEVKSYILRAMHMKNLLGTPEAIQRIAGEMARFDADHSVQKRKDLATFLQEQDERYGPDWLTRDAGNQVLDVLCRYRRYRDAFDFLGHMHARAESIPVQFVDDIIAARPDVVSFNTIMSHARRHGKFNILVNTLYKMKTEAYATQPDRVTLHLLFELAWHLRMRATVSVIWRYAALARLTTWRMRVRVAALLNWEPGDRSEYRLTPSAYRRLGGENLARDLAGGKAALDRIRSIAAGRNRAELAVLAAKVWPEAFEEFGPTVSLASALSLAASRDWAFWQAEKHSEKALRELRRRLKPKILPLRERREMETGWADLAPLDPVDPDLVDLEYGWAEIKALNVLHSDSPRERKGLVLSDMFGNELPMADDEGTVANSENIEERKPFRKVMLQREISIMNPKLWGDEADVPGGGRWKFHGWSALQMIMEEDILAALKRLEKDYSVPHEGLPDDRDREGSQLSRDSMRDEDIVVEELDKDLPRSQDWEGPPLSEGFMHEGNVVEEHDETDQGHSNR